MIKKVIITLILLTPFWVIAQGVSFKRFSLPEISDGLNVELTSYTRNYGKNLKRNISLDSCAKSRANYFLDVIETNSSENKSFFSMSDHIPNNKYAHNKCFGDTVYFKSPKTRYPEKFGKVQHLGLEISGEIMQQIIWEKSFSEKKGIESIVDISISEIKKNYKSTISNQIFKGYKGSVSHNSVIQKRGDGEYGTSTRILISERRVGDNWVYQVMIYNVTVFTGNPQ